MTRSMVCALPECQALPPEVRVCPCYAAATEEDIRTTWRHVDAPATRTVRVPVNAPSAATAAEAVRLQLTREGRRFLSVTASPRAGADRPDPEVAIVVTRPAGRRSTFTVFVEVPS